MPDQVGEDRRFLRRAARLALRGHGGAEPNPMVGCIVTARSGDVVGWGYHRRCGDAHAEVHALRMAGSAARGATAYVTLEPCNHTGRTPPCAEALVAAGVARVVIGRRDPHPDAAGGAERLRKAGLSVDVLDDDPFVTSITDPFVHRVRTGLPWVTAKWAQTVDGRIATRTGESRWISSAASRRLVHRERGRVDAILTGIGTVIADDPMLTARDVRIRRTARRVVIDPKLQMPLEARLMQKANEYPTTIACHETLLEAGAEKARLVHEAGVELIGIPLDGEALPLEPVLRALADRHDATNVLVEAGAGLLARLFEQQLVNDVWVFIGPRLLGDERALPAVRGRAAPSLGDAVPFRLLEQRRRGDDIVARYRVVV